jgi:hypothetical protein
MEVKFWEFRISATVPYNSPIPLLHIISMIVKRFSEIDLNIAVIIDNPQK